jgi:hypothetical protein
VESKTAAARQRVVEVDAVVEREKDSVLRKVEADTTEISFEEMLVAIRNNIDNDATSDEEIDEGRKENREDNNFAVLNSNDKPRWIVEIINKSKWEWLDICHMNLQKHKELKTAAWADGEVYLHECDK